MAFDPDAYLSGGTAVKEFDPDAYLAGDTELPEVVATQSEGGGGFLEKVNAALRKPSPAWLQAPESAARELVTEMVPHDLPSYLKSILGPAGTAFETGQALAQGDVSGIPLVGRVPEIMAADETPAFSKERYKTALKTLMDVGALAGAVESPRIPLRAEPLVPEPPPTQAMGPGTIAGDVQRALDRRFTMQEPPPEAPPQLAPAPPIEETLPNLPSEPPVFNPELGPQTIPEFQMPLRTETAMSPGARPLTPRAAKQLARLKAHKAQVEAIGGKVDPDKVTAKIAEIEGVPQEGPVKAPEGVPVAEPAPATPVLEIPPEPYTPEAAAAREAQPQPATEPVGGNVAGFEKVYGPGEIPAGETVSPEGAWDAASARAQGGKAQPYGFVDRAKTGAVTPEEMGDLIYEHHRLVERAAGMEGMPEYAEASQAAKDFASNVLKPAETAWHQKGMVMQIERPVNLNTFTGMDQLMQTELNRGIKPSEAPKFTRMAKDIKNGEAEVAKAVERSDARVRAKYAKVRDIPIEEAVARVKQMLKDCV